MTARLLMIALDGMDGRMLDRRSADGSLPSLGALRSHGRAKRLSAQPGLTDDALWASFQYAVDVGEHGRYHYWVRHDCGGFGFAHPEEVDRDIFWDELACRGLRVAVLDVPKCRAPRPINGIHVADWLVHGRYFSEPQSCPASLAAEILARFGPAPPSRCAYVDPILADDDIREITGHLRAAVAKKRAAGLYYLQAEPWDLFIIGFKEMHCCSHAFWDFTDVHHPAHDPARTSRLGDPAMTILNDIDGAIGDLVAKAGPETEVVVFSTTDIEPNGSLDHLMSGIVVRLNKHLAAPSLGPRRFAGWRCQMLPYNENVGALRISHDRRIGGGAAPDTDQSAGVIEEIRSMLCDLTDADTGANVVSSFTRPSAEFQGSRAASLPDLLIHYRSNIFPRAVVSSRLGRIGVESPRMRPGNHVAGGFFIVSGQAICTAADGVSSMADFGPLADRVLGSSESPLRSGSRSGSRRPSA